MSLVIDLYGENRKVKQKFMKRLIVSTTISLMAVIAGTMHAASIVSSFSSVNNGSASGASASYRNNGQVQGDVVKDCSSPSYRSYSGFVPAQTSAPIMSVIDNSMSFIDESPTSADTQTTTSLTFKVTLQVSGGNSISSVSYKFSNAGTDGLATATLQTDVSTDTVITPNTKIRYKVTFPNAGGQSLSVSENNYIEWFAKNNGVADASPAIYRIRVRAPATPTFAVTQPDTKGGYASTQPLIQATLNDPDLVVDTATVNIKIVRGDGTRPADLDIRSSDHPQIYSAAKNLIYYKYAGTSLTPNAVYNVTVSALDKSGTNQYSSAVSVTVKSGAIADLVPYPSPFDPRIQPVALRYVLDKKCSVSVNIYDMSGRVVRNIVNKESRDPGVNEETWAGANYSGDTLANGVYFCEIVARDEDGEHRRYSSLAIFGK